MVALVLVSVLAVVFALIGAVERVKRDRIVADERNTLLAAVLAKHAGEFTSYERAVAMAEHPSQTEPLERRPRPKLVGATDQ